MLRRGKRSRLDLLLSECQYQWPDRNDLQICRWYPLCYKTKTHKDLFTAHSILGTQLFSIILFLGPVFFSPQNQHFELNSNSIVNSRVTVLFIANLCVLHPFWLTDWQADCVTYWVTDWLTDWLTDRLTDWLAGWLADWLTDRMSVWRPDGRTDGRMDGWHSGVRGLVSSPVWVLSLNCAVFLGKTFDSLSTAKKLARCYATGPLSLACSL